MFGLMPWTKDCNSARPLTRADNPFALLRQEFDTLFGRFFGRWPLTGDFEAAGGWGLDVEDSGKEYVVRAEAPGFEANDFDVQLAGEQLRIVAEHKEEAREGEPAQTSQRRLERWVTVPGGADFDKIEARYRNGVLEVHLPKTPEAQGRRIEVKT